MNNFDTRPPAPEGSSYERERQANDAAQPLPPTPSSPQPQPSVSPQPQPAASPQAQYSASQPQPAASPQASSQTSSWPATHSSPESQPTQAQSSYEPTTSNPRPDQTHYEPTASNPRPDQTHYQPRPDSASRTQESYYSRPSSPSSERQSWSQNQPLQPVQAAQPPKKSHPFWWGLLAGVICSGALLGILWLTGNIGPRQVVAESNPAGQTVSVDVNGEDVTLAEVVSAKCLPSVVSIISTMDGGAGSGSGVILDTEGHVLTNHHVIDGAQTISCTIDNSSYEASVVGSDPSSDLAVIKVELGDKQVTPIEVGDASQLEVGEWVMAIGSPFGLDQSVSSGIVSSLYRSTMVTSYGGNKIYTNLIQTDAAINPGNSGGALVNEKGQLVGINSIYQSSTYSSAGVGFAIPSNYAINVAQTIIAGQQVQHAYLGVNVRTVTAQIATANNLPVSQGAYVVSVTDGGPAAEAGFQEGDIITAIGDDQVTSADGLILAVRSHAVGDKVNVTYWRGQEEKTVEIALGSDASATGTDSTGNTQDQQQQQSPDMQQQLVPDQGQGQGIPEDLQNILEQLLQ